MKKREDRQMSTERKRQRSDESHQDGGPREKYSRGEHQTTIPTITADQDYFIRNLAEMVDALIKQRKELSEVIENFERIVEAQVLQIEELKEKLSLGGQIKAFMSFKEKEGRLTSTLSTQAKELTELQNQNAQLQSRITELEKQLQAVKKEEKSVREQAASKNHAGEDGGIRTPSPPRRQDKQRRDTSRQARSSHNGQKEPSHFPMWQPPRIDRNGAVFSRGNRK